MIRTVIHPDYENLRDFIAALPENFDNNGKVIYNKRNQVRVISPSEDQILVVKRFRKPRLIDKIAYLFGKKTKGQKAYEVGNRLMKEGIRTPFPIAYITESKGLIPTRSYFISSYTLLPSVNDYIEKPDFDHALAYRLGGFVAALHSKNIMHGDLNGSNILVDKDSFVLIDNNRTRFYSPNSKQAARNLMRITTDEDRIREIAYGYADAVHIDKTVFARKVIREQTRFRKSKTLRHAVARKLHLRK